MRSAVNMDPDVLVIDECSPWGTSASNAQVLGRVKEFQQEGRTILLVTHSKS